MTGYALAFGLPLATSVIGMVLAGVWSNARGPAASMRVGVPRSCSGCWSPGWRRR